MSATGGVCAGSAKPQSLPVRPLGHLLFAAPRTLDGNWVLHAPGHREHSQPVPAKFLQAINKKGTLALPGGTFSVYQESDGLDARWTLEAPGHKENGHPVPEAYIKNIVCDGKTGSLLLGAGRFTVMWQGLSSSTASETRRRVRFDSDPEVRVIQSTGGAGWVFDSPGYSEHGMLVPEAYTSQIEITGTSARISLPSGCFAVVQQAGDFEQSRQWVLSAPGHAQNGRPVPQKYVERIVHDLKTGTLILPGGSFNVVERPAPAYKKNGCAPFPMKRTKSEVLMSRPDDVTLPKTLRRVTSAPCSVGGG